MPRASGSISKACRSTPGNSSANSNGPTFDLIDGLQPTISIDQRAAAHNPRSTVATVTEVYDYLRLLYARLGEASCWRCGAAIRQQTPEQILDVLLSRAEGTRIMILAPLVRGRKGEHQEVFERVRKAGFLRARVDGVVVDVNDPPQLARQKTHTIEAVIDRVVVREGVRSRLAESINLAVRHGDGLVLASHEEKPTAGQPVWHDELYSTQYACPKCKVGYEALEPRSFSFNSPYGACPVCEGLGVRVAFDPELVLPRPEISLADGAIVPWKESPPAALAKLKHHLRGWLTAAGCRWNTPLEKLKPRALAQLLQGDGKEFAGVLALLEKEYAATSSESKRQRLETFRGEVVCPECKGSRLRPEAPRSASPVGRSTR